MALKRGNPNWASGKVADVTPAIPTEFETVARGLKLDQKGYVNSERLREWCALNRNRRYVPEWLLEAWEMRVNADQFEAVGTYREIR